MSVYNRRTIYFKRKYTDVYESVMKYCETYNVDFSTAVNEMLKKSMKEED